MYCSLLLTSAARRVALLLALAGLAQPAFAANKTWVGGPDFNYTDWFDPSMWSPAGVPTAADNVTIPGGLDSYPLVTSDLNRSGSTTISAGATLDFDANFSNSGTLAVYGVLGLAANWAFLNTGPLTVNNGGVLTTYSTLSNGSGGTLTVASGGWLEVYEVFVNSANLNLSGNSILTIYPGAELHNTGTFLSTGSIFNYGSFYHTSGSVTHNGTYTGEGSYLSSTFVNPTSGILGVDGAIDDLTFGAGFTNSGTIKFEFRSANFDKITVSGTATLGGTFTASFPDGVPNTGTQFTVLTATTRTGTFTNSSVNLGGGKYANVSYTSNSVKISVASAPLPIELSDFTARWLPTQQAVQLDWRTAQEHNNQGFEVQRSTDGVRWDALSFVNGHGTTAQAQAYSLQDPHPAAGLNYYRLRQLDTDGQADFSNVVTVKTNRSGGLSGVQVFPNPADETLHIRLPDDLEETGDVTALFLNATGQQVRSVVLKNNANVLNVSDLEPGVTPCNSRRNANSTPSK